jgi:hypothetical protein
MHNHCVVLRRPSLGPKTQTAAAGKVSMRNEKVSVLQTAALRMTFVNLGTDATSPNHEHARQLEVPTGTSLVLMEPEAPLDPEPEVSNVCILIGTTFGLCFSRVECRAT